MVSYPAVPAVWGKVRHWDGSVRSAICWRRTVMPCGVRRSGMTTCVSTKINSVQTTKFLSCQLLGQEAEAESSPE